MKKIIENANAQQILEAFHNEETVFICPPIKDEEKAYYSSLFKQHAPDKTVSFLSSGSTGNPKLIVHSWANLKKRALAQAIELELNTESHYLSPLPIHHLSGFMPVLRTELIGAKLSIKEKSNELIDFIKTIRPTHISLVPSQLNDLVKANTDLSFLKSLLLGGSGCSDELLNKARVLGYPIRACYGMTESASFFSISSAEEFKESGAINLHLMKGWSGFAQNSGRLTIESNELFLGSITGKGLLRSGGILPTFDIGDVNAPYINIYGRSDLVYLSGGEKVDPLEVERKLQTILNTDQIVVIPKNDNKWGQVTCAFLSPFDKSINYDQIVKDMPAHQRPRHFFELEEVKGIKPKRAELKIKLENIFKKPKMAFLHGFMGSSNDLLPLGDCLKADAVYWSLPFHNDGISLNSFEEVTQFYAQKVIDENVDILYGYSMGGRLATAVAEALAFKKRPLKALVIESSHPGLCKSEEKLERVSSDESLFEKMPKEPKEFFDAWYSLPLFGDFKDTNIGKTKIDNLIKSWNPVAWSKALSVLSTGHQKDYRAFLLDSPHPILYLCGEKDLKYKSIADELADQGSFSLIVKCLENGSHNLHGPLVHETASLVNAFLSSCN